MVYKYETHLHTYPVSKCATASVEATLDFYKKIGYDGVFITNHFIDGNTNISKNLNYNEQINQYFSDYENGVLYGKKIGIKVFLGVEMSYAGSYFLIYGLDKAWYINNPQIMNMKKSDELKYIRENGGFVVHAHPYREAEYIDHIRLYPRCVDAVEIINAGATCLENDMALHYAESYNLFKTAGTDNHSAEKQYRFAGVTTEYAIIDEIDYINSIKNGNANLFVV